VSGRVLPSTKKHHRLKERERKKERKKKIEIVFAIRKVSGWCCCERSLVFRVLVTVPGLKVWVCNLSLSLLSKSEIFQRFVPNFCLRLSFSSVSSTSHVSLQCELFRVLFNVQFSLIVIWREDNQKLMRKCLLSCTTITCVISFNPNGSYVCGCSFSIILILWI